MTVWTVIDWITPSSLSTLDTVLLVVASFFTSALSAAFGVGGGVSLLVVMLSLMPPAIVLPLHGIVQSGSNASRTSIMFSSVHWKVVGWFSIGSFVGIAIASLIFVAIPDTVLRLILGIFILWSLWAPGPAKRDIPEPAFSLVGAVASFCTMFVGATGVLVAVFWSVAKLTKQGVVATHAACMTLQHGFKVIAFGFLGFAFGEWLGILIAMVISGFLGTVLGKRILARVPEQLFAKGFKLVLTLLALRLLIDAFMTTAS